MKKVIGIFITMVMVFVMVSMALGDNDGIAYSTNDYEAEELIRNWAESEGLYDWTMTNDVNGVLYYIGGLKVEHFREQNGVEWSVQNFNDCSMKEWEISEINTVCVGKIDGVINVYHSKAHSDSKVLVYHNNVDYYDCDVLFIVYTEYEGGMQ